MCWGGERTGEGDGLVIKPSISSSHQGLGFGQPVSHLPRVGEAQELSPHLSGGDRSRRGGEGAGEWGAAEPGQGGGPWGPQQAGRQGGAADSSQHSTTVGDGVLITGVDAYVHKDTEGSIQNSPAPPVRWLGEPVPRNIPLDLATHTKSDLLAKKGVSSRLSGICLTCRLIRLPCWAWGIPLS